MAIYLYAITEESQQSIKPYDIRGLYEGIVYSIPYRNISVVVSDVSVGKVRPERRHLAAHQAVVRSVMARGPMLPMAFGIIADSRNSTAKLLTRHHGLFTQQLRRVAGKVEMGVRVSWDVPNIFEYLVTVHPELKDLRERFWDSGREPLREEKIKIGQLFDQLINSDREKYTEMLESMLSSRCFEMKRLPIRSEHEIANLAFLVDEGILSEFEVGILEAGQQFDDKFVFQNSGPWAPHNFVELQIRL